MQEQSRVGTACLQAATELLHRIARADPTAALLEPADLHWWWRTPRRTDTLPQLVWFDDAGRPAAAVIATAWDDAVALDPILLPDATPDWSAHVIRRALEHAEASGLRDLDVVLDADDTVLRDVLLTHGFAVSRDDALDVVLAQLVASERPSVGAPADGYRLLTRRDTAQRPHHMTARNGPDVEARLRQSPLYRPELDLLVLDARGDVAAYGLFWLDPETATGLVEPMRTEDAHQRRGLARLVLASGLDRLAAAGAERIKVCFRPASVGARELYLGAGFRPYKRTTVLARRGSDGAD